MGDVAADSWRRWRPAPETYATAVRFFHSWAVVQREVSPACDPSRVVRHRVVGLFGPNAELMNGWRASLPRRTPTTPAAAPGIPPRHGNEAKGLDIN